MTNICHHSDITAACQLCRLETAARRYEAVKYMAPEQLMAIVEFCQKTGQSNFDHMIDQFIEATRSGNRELITPAQMVERIKWGEQFKLGEQEETK